MKKSHIFLIVFLISAILSFLIANSIIRESFMSEVGRDLNYNDTKELWENNSYGVHGILIIGSLIIGAILGGISTIFIRKDK